MSPIRPERRRDSLPARIAISLIRTGSTLQTKEAWAARSEDLPALQAILLMRIHNSPETECTVGHLATALGLTPPTVSDSLKAIVRKGLLERRRSPDDGRVIYFRCTHQGRVKARRLGRWAESVETSIAALGVDDQSKLMELLSRVLRDRAEEGLPVPDRMCASCQHIVMGSGNGSASFRCLLLGVTMRPEELQTDCPDHRALTVTAGH